MDFGYALTRSLYIHGGTLFPKTHGGLTAFDLGVAPVGFADLFLAVEPYVWGRDTHDGIAYTVGSTWYFDFSKRHWRAIARGYRAPSLRVL